MTYAREKRLLLGWLALVAPIPLPFNGILEWPILAAFMGACLLFLRRAARDPGGWLPVWSMNLLAVVYTPYFLFDLAVLSRGRLVVAVTHLLLFAVLVKLFAVRRERDKWQAAVAIFFLFLTAMGTSVHPTVVLYLVLFVGLTLLVFSRFAQLHLMAAFAATEEQRRTLSAIPMRGFLVGSTVVALVLAAPLFALLPRVESPFVPGRGQGLGTLGAATGFSDVVTLDSIGSIRTNREVAMRLRYEGELPPGHELRYRGGAFERYGDGTWRRGHSRQGPSRRERRGRGVLRLASRQPVGWVEVFLRPVAGRHVLLPPEAVVIESEGAVMSMDDRGLVDRHGRGSDAFEYRVGLAAGPVSRALPPYGPEGSPQREASTLDLSGVTPRIAELSAEVAGEGSTAEQARRIERFLTTEFEYSLEFVGERGENPVGHFLFERREGHCEYFATAMVLMLRSRGIPARLATGFLGGELNPLEDYYVVRQSNAHAWVEAYLPERGWSTFDPTPPSGRPVIGEAGLAQMLAQAWDYVLFRWDRYVLTYGFGDQMQVLFFFRSAWQEITSWFADDGADASAEEPATIVDAGEGDRSGAAGGPEPGPARWLPWVAVPAALALLLLWWRRLRRPLTGPDAYRRLRRTAARAGLRLAPADPPLAFARRLARRFPDAASPGGEVVRLYVRESWQEEELGEAERQRLGEALRAATSTLKKAG